jgi:hypothetical protein
VRNFVCIASLLLLFSLSAFAADYPKAEVFGGYQYTHLEGGVNGNGWNIAVTGNLNNWFGVTGDFSGAYATVDGVSLKNTTYTFGPVVSLRENKGFTPFAHVLVGGLHTTASISNVGSGSANGFATFAGGGVDVNVSPHLSVRPGQFDWFLAHVSGSNSSKNFRYSAGVVFRF